MIASNQSAHNCLQSAHEIVTFPRAVTETYLCCLVIKLNIVVYDHRIEVEVRRDLWRSSSQPTIKQGQLEQVA